MSHSINFFLLGNLILDPENTRFPISLPKANRSKREIINWLLENASIIELMLAIGNNDFFIGDPLLVIKSNESEKYIVVEGNRRLTSLFLLNDSSLADIHTKKIGKVLEETTYRPTEIPCIVFNERSEILQYFGYRHITGIKSWNLVAKARYLNSLLEKSNGSTLTESSRELAKKIGSRSDYVKKILVSYQVYKVIEDSGFYKIPNLDDTSFPFNNIPDFLSKENIRKFIGVDFNNEALLIKLNEEHLEELINWLFRKNVHPEFSHNKSQFLGNNDQLKKLNVVLSNEESLQNFRDQGSLTQALKYVKQSEDTFHNDISNALQLLKHTRSYISNIEHHQPRDIDVLKEINALSRVMRDMTDGKDND